MSPVRLPLAAAVLLVAARCGGQSATPANVRDASADVHSGGSLDVRAPDDARSTPEVDLADGFAPSKLAAGSYLLRLPLEGLADDRYPAEIIVTLTIEPGAPPTAWLSVPGSVASTPLEADGGRWTATKHVRLRPSDGRHDYELQTFWLDGDLRAGRATGRITYWAGDQGIWKLFGSQVQVTPDAEPPRVEPLPASSPVHPMDSPQFITSEPLARSGEAAFLRAAGLGSIELVTRPETGPPARLVTPDRMLAWGTTYALALWPGAKGIDGLAVAGELPSFTTIADPGLLADGGFEGASPRLLLVGAAELVGPDVVRPISGDRSLYVPFPVVRGTRATIRLTSPRAGAHLRATWRSVASYNPHEPYTFTIAHPDGTLKVHAAMPTRSGAEEDVMIRDEPWTLGPPSAMDVVIDAAGPITVDLRTTRYEYPGGILIDDVRIE